MASKPRKPRTDRYEASGRKVARYARYSGPLVNHAGSHILTTEAQTLDDALNILANQKARKDFTRRGGYRRKPNVTQKDIEFGRIPDPKRKNITLPRVEFLERGRNENK